MAEAYSIFVVEEILLVSIHDDITDTDITDLQDRLSEDIVRMNARGVIIDISGLDVVDTFVGRILGQLAKVAKILAAVPYVVGMRPAVAMTLVELGMNLGDMRTALSVNHAMQHLRSEQ
ncbi:STAS domain-containing protein [Acuticoccus sp. MNP-M23]|uniref:STAS domain-containing protein n=1 Tax=Acuticoccus sp. MNP-M23 TaxID=3072793 RepID=UPI002815F4DA|nr:STAS domain-containing protein [Acuticoccus sp. MNP-M23]WMS43085.1 STAS domain-containing protein [Acuticoccus sp. MNP-M23]